MLLYSNIEAYAQKKLQHKNADVIIANNVGDRTIGFSSDDNDYTMYFKDGDALSLGNTLSLNCQLYVLQG